MRRIVLTGANGLLGWNAHVRLYAINCEAKFRGDSVPYDIVALNHSDFDDDEILLSAVKNTDAILHFAGINRGTDEDIAAVNPSIASRLIWACKAAGVDPKVVYANTTHSLQDTVYGCSKRVAGEYLKTFFSRYTDIIYPHIFGECARPFYNNVTATFIHQIIDGKSVNINSNGHVQLLYAGEAAQIAIDAAISDKLGVIQPKHYPISVPDLHCKLKCFHESYHKNIYPDLSHSFDLSLFNTYRSAIKHNYWARRLHQNTDERGKLFEAVKGGGGGQTFLSTTLPGVTRGNHFHLNKLERFLVIRGEAVVRIRKVKARQVLEYKVSGDRPTAIDIPTLHTHSIENVGTEELITLFWTHELFDPDHPDTYADRVLL